jgi:Arc/MetJ family transcription regulator
MRTTLNLDDELVRRASELTGRTEKATLVRLGLEALITQESSRRLAALGGSDPRASSAPRHREHA